jgi:hypothetical protein
MLLQLIKFINGDEFSGLVQFLKLFCFLFRQRACFLFPHQPSRANPVQVMAGHRLFRSIELLKGIIYV